MSLTTMEETTSFRYVHLDQIDPSFTPIDTDFYNLKIVSAEIRAYGPTEKSPEGGEYINFGFAVTDNPKFAGRRIYESLFPNSFTLKVLRRIQDATGIDQAGNTEEWLKTLGSVAPIVKLKVAGVPDLMRDGTPNPKNVKSDGTPGTKNVIDWKAGVQPGD